MEIRFLRCVLLSLWIPGVAFALSSATPPVGCFPIDLSEGGKTFVGLPLERATVFASRVESVSHNTIVVAANPGWAADELAGDGPEGEFYFVQIMSGDLEGAVFPILSNGERSLLISPEGEDLAGIRTGGMEASGDILRVIPYWTPSSVFRHSMVPVGTELLLFDSETYGFGAYEQTNLILNGEGQWVDDRGDLANAYPLRPGFGFVVDTPEVEADVRLDLVGCVPISVERRVFFANGSNVAYSMDANTNVPSPLMMASISNQESERLFALSHPESVPLQMGGFEFVNRTTVFAYDGPHASFENPSSVFTYFEGFGWFDQSFGFVGGDVALEPGKAYIVRIPPANAPVEWVWTREPAYLGLL